PEATARAERGYPARRLFHAEPPRRPPPLPRACARAGSEPCAGASRTGTAADVRGSRRALPHPRPRPEPTMQREARESTRVPRCPRRRPALVVLLLLLAGGAAAAPQGTTERVNLRDSNLQGNGGSVGPSLSADGGRLAFMSLASDLVHGDT